MGILANYGRGYLIVQMLNATKSVLDGVRDFTGTPLNDRQERLNKLKQIGFRVRLYREVREALVDCELDTRDYDLLVSDAIIQMGFVSTAPDFVKNLLGRI